LTHRLTVTVECGDGRVPTRVTTGRPAGQHRLTGCSTCWW